MSVGTDCGTCGLASTQILLLSTYSLLSTVLNQNCVPSVGAVSPKYIAVPGSPLGPVSPRSPCGP